MPIPRLRVSALAEAMREGRERLLAGHPILRLAVDLRNPYVDALSFLQLRFLRELQESDGPLTGRLSELVRLTVGGIAAGLQNTG